MCIPTLPGGVLADTEDAGQLAMQVVIQSRAGRGAGVCDLSERGGVSPSFARKRWY